MTTLKDFIKGNFEANFLDGDKVNDCGGATFSTHGALDIAEHFYELGKQETLDMVMREIENLEIEIDLDFEQMNGTQYSNGYEQALSTLKQKLLTNIK